jgi:hypothetical protein
LPQLKESWADSNGFTQGDGQVMVNPIEKSAPKLPDELIAASGQPRGLT